jgi:serine/threonine-protein kinase HipA
MIPCTILNGVQGMATFLWAKVYFQDHFAGILSQEPGDSVSFQYDNAYLHVSHPAIAHTMPLQPEPYMSHSALPPFFDNLVSEGWLEQAQACLLGKRNITRFERLLAFGYDCVCAVSIIDPEPVGLSALFLEKDDPKEKAVFMGRASLSGVQPKLAIVERDGKYYPARAQELSTHIAKFSSADHRDLIFNASLITHALKAFLPEENVMDLSIGCIEGQSEEALLIKRFDRLMGGRIHCEEFNQLFAQKSSMKYEGSYKDMSGFIRNTPGCVLAENQRLYGRILAGVLLGNTDMHLKNFAMLHTPLGLRLAPVYDTVAAQFYHYKIMALAMAGSQDFRIANLKARHIILLGKECALAPAAIKRVIEKLGDKREYAKRAIAEAPVGTQLLKDKLIDMMEKRWNGIFALIGKTLLEKP